MAIEILHLAECPYCFRGEGGIFLYVPELYREFQRSEEHPLSIFNCPHAGYLIFNSIAEANAPCPHWLGLMFHCDVDVKTAGRWSREAESGANPWYPCTDRLPLFVKQALSRKAPPQFKGEIPISQEKFSLRWSKSTDDQEERAYNVTSTAYFSPDVAGIVKRAPSLVKGYRKWCAAQEELQIAKAKEGSGAGWGSPVQPVE